MSDLTAKQVFDALNRPNESDNYSDFLTKDELRAAKVLLDDIHSSSPLVAELISKRSEIANQTNDEWFWESSVSRADFEKYFEAANQTSRERERRHSVLNDPSSEATLARVSQGKLAGKAFQELSHWTGSISKDDTKHLVEQLRERKDETSAIVLTTLSNDLVEAICNSHRFAIFGTLLLTTQEAPLPVEHERLLTSPMVLREQ